uniref:Cytochrome c oxidase subunit 2 n=1 Tax=Nectonemertes cf. mirabilis HC-2011 TaxID=992350 RepID=I1SR52_9BILA|nr:cytochrome c oxidase subunit II [Nectonemertes cf. mirabilis HC-2011]ADZ05372.1 cytochrome c oxidase subunit II [Nectonemertes cf. mirabilis HC-2011]
MTFWSSWGFQDASSPIMEQLIFFHDHAVLMLLMIMSFCMYIFIMLLYKKNGGRFFLECQEVEAFWTVLPGVLLVFLAFPSLRLLYLLDEVNDVSLTIKVMGHQWYWSYEFSDFLGLEYDSFMLGEEELSGGMYRLLEVDNRTVVPCLNDIRVLVSAADVLYSWGVPSLGVKVDAIPGRLNQLSFYCSRVGVYYGQCSEICGANHSFMPIVLEVVDLSVFTKWIKMM